MAEKVAEKIASFEIKEKKEKTAGAIKIKQEKLWKGQKIQIAKEKIIGISNQVRY